MKQFLFSALLSALVFAVGCKKEDLPAPLLTKEQKIAKLKTALETLSSKQNVATLKYRLDSVYDYRIQPGADSLVIQPDSGYAYIRFQAVAPKDGIIVMGRTWESNFPGHLFTGNLETCKPFWTPANGGATYIYVDGAKVATLSVPFTIVYPGTNYSSGISDQKLYFDSKNL